MGSLDKTSKNVGTGLVGAPACGDVMKLQVQMIFTFDGNGIPMLIQCFIVYKLFAHMPFHSISILIPMR